MPLGDTFGKYNTAIKGEGGENMQSATERRQQMIEYISDRRSVKLQELMNEFQISRRTAIRDVELLTCSYPLYTVVGNGGGIRVADGWYLGRRYLRKDQEELLRRLLPGLQPDEQKTMQRILDSFATPNINQ